MNFEIRTILCTALLSGLAGLGCGRDAAPSQGAETASMAGSTAMTASPTSAAGTAAGSGNAGSVAMAGAAAPAGRGPLAGVGAAGMGAAPPDDADAGMMPTGATPPAAGPVLPAVSDPAQPGPFGAEVVATAPGLDTHKLYVPGKLGDNGVKHPIIVWTNGAGGSTNFYENLLRHFASHGFFVVADKMSGGNHNPEIVEQKAGIEWAIAEAQRAGSPYSSTA